MFDSTSAFGLFVFFKQKTAYEMRISDWSSDVCSSDLQPTNGSCRPIDFDILSVLQCLHYPVDADDAWLAIFTRNQRSMLEHTSDFKHDGCRIDEQRGPAWVGGVRDENIALFDRFVVRRSEEHTSELQSLMRISYAVFCLKKQTN